MIVRSRDRPASVSMRAFSVASSRAPVLFGELPRKPQGASPRAAANLPASLGYSSERMVICPSTNW
jgi:hypothetical protein